MSKQKGKIIVGLSGGVDSSVAAWKLKQAGWQVEGLFMKNWEDEPDCPAAGDLLDAQKVCDVLHIPLHTVNFSQEYWHHVFEHFLAEYAAGRTPNPDVLCNKEIKFKAFLDYAKRLGGECIATGHYARVAQTPAGAYQLKCAEDSNKDQTYFLYTLGQAQLRDSLFPLGEMQKTEVRQSAKALGLVTHDKKDSTGICFIGERRFREFLNRYLPAKPGLIRALDDDRVVGEHQGAMYYTHGQRQGLGIGGQAQAPELPWYVAKKSVTDNVLYVVQGREHPALYQSLCEVAMCSWVGDAPQADFPCTAKVRYRQRPAGCQVTVQTAGCVEVRFDEPQWAVTPGQSVVFYRDDVCLGGGVIV